MRVYAPAAWLAAWTLDPGEAGGGFAPTPAAWGLVEMDCGVYLHRGQREWNGRAVDWRRHKRLLGRAYRADAVRGRAR